MREINENNFILFFFGIFDAERYAINGKCAYTLITINFITQLKKKMLYLNGFLFNFNRYGDMFEINLVKLILKL